MPRLSLPALCVPSSDTDPIGIAAVYQPGNSTPRYDLGVTPMTENGAPRMLTILPTTALSPGKSCSAKAYERTTTGADVASSCGEIERPRSTRVPTTEKYSPSTKRMLMNSRRSPTETATPLAPRDAAKAPARDAARSDCTSAQLNILSRPVFVIRIGATSCSGCGTASGA